MGFEYGLDHSSRETMKTDLYRLGEEKSIEKMQHYRGGESYKRLGEITVAGKR